MKKLNSRLKIPLRRALAALLVAVLLPFSAAALAERGGGGGPDEGRSGYSRRHRFGVCRCGQ